MYGYSIDICNVCIYIYIYVYPVTDGIRPILEFESNKFLIFVLFIVFYFYYIVRLLSYLLSLLLLKLSPPMEYGQFSN